MTDSEWCWSPAEGEIGIDVTTLTDEEIRLVHKEIEAEFKLAGGCEIMFVDGPDGLSEWWIYKGQKL